MLNSLGDKKEEAVNRMKSLNKAISETDGLNENYHIGAAYFLKLKDLNFEELWEEHLKPLLQDYVRGMYGEKELMENFENAYNLKNEKKDNENNG
jgi:5-methylcytosine-specific restriction protein B